MIWTFHNTSELTASHQFFTLRCSPNIQNFIYCFFFVCFTDESDDGLSQSRNISFENKIQGC